MAGEIESPEPTGGEAAAERRRDSSTRAIRVNGNKTEPEEDADRQAHRGATETSVTAMAQGTRRGDRRRITAELGSRPYHAAAVP